MRQDEDDWPNWLFFLVILEAEPSIWAVKAEHLRTVLVIKQESATPFNISKYLTQDSGIKRFRVIRKFGRYYPAADEFSGKEPEFDDDDNCLYIGTFSLSLRGIKAIMAEVAIESVQGQPIDPFNFCKDFVRAHFGTNKGLSAKQEKAFKELMSTKTKLSVVRVTAGVVVIATATFVGLKIYKGDEVPAGLSNPEGSIKGVLSRFLQAFYLIIT